MKGFQAKVKLQPPKKKNRHFQNRKFFSFVWVMPSWIRAYSTQLNSEQIRIGNTAVKDSHPSIFFIPIQKQA